MNVIIKMGLVVMTAITPPATYCQTDDAHLYLSKSFASEHIERVTGSAISGNIMVTGSSGKEIEVNVYARSVNGAKDELSAQEIQRRINACYSIRVEVKDRELIASVGYQAKDIDWKNQLAISLEILLPEQLPVDINAINGNIMLRQFAGKANIFSSSGNLRLDNVKGNITGSTSGGDIFVFNTKSIIHLTTEGGNIVAKNSSGDLQLHTTGGMISLANLHGKIKVETTGGRITGSNVTGEVIAYAKGQQVFF